ncbi:copper resistance CopC family protein [Micromonospora sp. WMMD737]|uniref:copper resistance CopC family protein n=1 Tax=Micromonospora sp. WMMD737 TaxID=3404113 RepID=UPI003B95FFF6
MRTRTRPTVAAFIAATLTTLALLLAPASPAAAHNTLQAATPAKDARLTTAPTQITLRFMQKLEPTFTTIVLSDASQRKIPTGEPTVDGTTGTVTIDEPLVNGTYTVAYQVISPDGHPVQGSYQFTVADPTASPASATAAASPASATAAPATESATASPTPAAASRDSGDRPTTLVLALVLVGGGILLVAIVVAGIVVLARRRPSRSS